MAAAAVRQGEGMSGFEALRVVGLMSGTSLDGIDAAVVITDGEDRIETGPWLTTPYQPALRERLRASLGGAGDIAGVERDLTRVHAQAVKALLADCGLTVADIALIGMHGHTILHRPFERRTWQIGDGALLASLTGIDVVCDFRAADVAAGGQGAPLVPLFHRAMAGALAKPLAVLNVGGVANVTWIGADDRLIAFDTGPGGALMDDWARRHGAGLMDAGGALASAGRVDSASLAALLTEPYFDRPPPKSLDRDHFAAVVNGVLARLLPADGAATLTAFTAAAVARALEHFPQDPRRWLICGGGRKNPVLMAALAGRLQAPVGAVDQIGWQGDALEAQAFAYLAVRSRRGLALSLPETTGVAQPTTGGRLFRADSKQTATGLRA